MPLISRRMLAATVVVVAVLPAAGANATASRAHCRHLITDPVGDTQTLAAPSLGTNDNTRTLDIVAADVATNKRTITVSVKVDKLAYQGTNLNVNIYEVRFVAAHGSYYLTASSGPDGSSATMGKFDGTYAAHGASATTGHGIGPATVVFDTVHNEVRISADRSLVAADGPLGPKLTQIEAWTWRGYGTGAGHGPISGPGWTAEGIDDTLTDATYRTDAPACIAP